MNVDHQEHTQTSRSQDTAINGGGVAVRNPESPNHWRTNDANSVDREEGRRIFGDQTIWFKVTEFGLGFCSLGEPEFDELQKSLDSTMIVPVGRMMPDHLKKEMSLTYNGRIVKEVWIDEEAALRNKPHNPFATAYLNSIICGDMIVIMHYAEA